MNKLVIHIFTLVCFCFFGVEQALVAQTNCQDTVKLDLVSNLNGNQVQVALKSKNISACVGLFFRIGYDAEVMTLDSVNTILDGIENFEGTKGLINFLWLYNPSTGPVNISDEESIVTMFFTVKDPFAKGFFSVQSPEIITENRTVCVEPLTKVISLTDTSIKGTVFRDRNLNCSLDPGEEGLQNYIIELNNGQNLYRVSDRSGHFSCEVPAGLYTVVIHLDQELWTVCSLPSEIEVLAGQNLNIDIGLRPVQICPSIAVNLTAPILENCANNNYTLTYQNIGNAPTDIATVELSYGQDMTLVSTSFNNFTLKPNAIVFNIGQLEVNEYGTIEVVLNLNCFTTYEGQTHCVQAISSPRGLCGNRDNYNGPELIITSQCDEANNKAMFTIKNIGLLGMSTSSNYIVTEDDVLKPGGSFILDAQAEISLSFDADGSTYRVTTNQNGLFPTRSIPTLALEGCGNVPINQKSIGFYNVFENDDRDIFKDIDCQVIASNNAPINMRSYPSGVGPKNFISKDIYIEYLITFQNITNEVLNSALIKNLISPLLDISTLEVSGSSHPMSFTINKDRELYVVMDSLNIDKNITPSRPGLGFIKYKIKVDQSAPLNATIVNKADVHLNFGLASSTNFIVLTIGEKFLVSVESGSNNIAEITLYPNPVTMGINVIGIENYTQLKYKITPLVSQNPIAEGVVSDNYIGMESLTRGIYLLRLTDDKNRTGIYKITKL